MTIYEKLKELKPNAIDGYVGCSVSAIVGFAGLKIAHISKNSKDHIDSYKEGDAIPIVSFDESGLIIQSAFGHFKCGYEKFKGLKSYEDYDKLSKALTEDIYTFFKNNKPPYPSAKPFDHGPYLFPNDSK